jgi:beta-galactosidase/beta-glucuronidase
MITLDDVWQVEQGGMDSPPVTFSHTVQVPGLLDMAQPPFSAVGKQSPERQAFWYRRTFKIDGPVPDIARLKIHKACWGTKVWLNGQDLGEHLPSFTPGYFDLKPALKGSGEENVLLVRVGADRSAIPKGMPSGWDFEKYLFTPGIYDSVELILTGAPFIENVQAIPETEVETVRAAVELQGTSAEQQVTLDAEVAEAKSGKTVGHTQRSFHLLPNETKTVFLNVPIPGCRLWSPEDPFLYELKIGSGRRRCPDPIRHAQVPV